MRCWDLKNIIYIGERIMEKKRYEILVAGCQLAIITDEREEFVNSVVENLDREIREITAATKRSSNLDAAILCAIQYYSDKVKAEKRARNLEAQISLYDANMRRFREENLALRKKLESAGIKTDDPEDPAHAVDTAAAPAGRKPITKIEKTKKIETKAEPKAAPVKEAPAKTESKAEQIPLEGAEKDKARIERLRTIDELLGRGNKKQ